MTSRCWLSGGGWWRVESGQRGKAWEEGAKDRGKRLETKGQLLGRKADRSIVGRGGGVWWGWGR